MISRFLTLVAVAAVVATSSCGSGGSDAAPVDGTPEPDGTLLIFAAASLTDGETRRRWAWPVALLPWEDAPGRVSITLTDWYRLSR